MSSPSTSLFLFRREVLNRFAERGDEAIDIVDILTDRLGEGAADVAACCTCDVFACNAADVATCNTADIALHVTETGFCLSLSGIRSPVN